MAFQLEVAVLVDKPVYEPGEPAQLLVAARSDASTELSLEVTSYKGVVAELSIALREGEVATKALEVEVPRIPGNYEFSVRYEGKLLDSVQFIVAPFCEVPVDRYLAFVYHHHQAPNYLPDGTYYYLWAFLHTWSDELAPYGKGAYHYHALILEKHRDYKCTYNLSPSLIAQWDSAIRYGVRYKGGFVPPSSSEVELVKEALSIYTNAARRGQIDVLTSMYAHSIAGYLIDYMGMEDVVREELEYGAEVTRKILGVEPLGVWTPEMAFTMKLVEIYADLGFKYTVLDAKCHLKNSKGEVGDELEPYLVRGSKGELVVFFRNTELSNYMSFKNSFETPFMAWKKAYEFTYLIARRLVQGGVLTIALDGENWMIFSKNPPLTAVFYEKLVEYVEKLQRSNYLKTATLRELVSKLHARRVLTWVPTTSWLCRFSKWNGEKAEHAEYWARARRVYEKIKAYEASRGMDERSKRARWAFWHAIDSDYWWAEFWEPTLISLWLEQAEKALEQK